MKLEDIRWRQSSYTVFTEEEARVSRREGVWYLIRMRTFESGEEESNGNFIERTVSVECLKPDCMAFVREEVVRQWKLFIVYALQDDAKAYSL